MSSFRFFAQAILAGALASTAIPLQAAELVVVVSGVKGEQGEVSCAVFSSAAGFPMDGAKAVMQRQKAATAPIEFKFSNLPAGTYAIAASHDRNSNQKTDKNFVGMPTEEWGVSNGIRPKLRAPKFEEASFALKEGETNRVEIQVAR